MIRIRPSICWTLIAALVLGLVSVWHMGTLLIGPAPQSLSEPAELAIEEVSFSSESGSTIRGWLVAGEAGAGCVILMHGLRSNRSSMIDRARFLSSEGFSVLLFDFQAEGESPGHQITFGYLESRDAAAAVAFVRQRCPDERIAVIGSSLGGAAALLGTGPVDVDALVLEAVFPDIRSAVVNRLRLRIGDASRVLAPLLLWQIEPRLGVEIDDLRPLDRIDQVDCPLMIIWGGRDQRTRVEESRQLAQRAGTGSVFWEIEGATHQDFHHFAKRRYEARVGAFLRENLTAKR